MTTAQLQECADQAQAYFEQPTHVTIYQGIPTYTWTIKPGHLTQEKIYILCPLCGEVYRDRQLLRHFQKSGCQSRAIYWAMIEQSYIFINAHIADCMLVIGRPVIRGFVPKHIGAFRDPHPFYAIDRQYYLLAHQAVYESVTRYFTSHRWLRIHRVQLTNTQIIQEAAAILAEGCPFRAILYINSVADWDSTMDRKSRHAAITEAHLRIHGQLEFGYKGATVYLTAQEILRPSFMEYLQAADGGRSIMSTDFLASKKRLIEWAIRHHWDVHHPGRLTMEIRSLEILYGI